MLVNIYTTQQKINYKISRYHTFIIRKALISLAVFLTSDFGNVSSFRNTLSMHFQNSLYCKFFSSELSNSVNGSENHRNLTNVHLIRYSIDNKIPWAFILGTRDETSWFIWAVICSTATYPFSRMHHLSRCSLLSTVPHGPS